MARNPRAVGLNVHRKTLYLTEELEALVRQDAYRQQTTESEVVREALAKYYASRKPAPAERTAGG
ncbi:MAG: hypothetical protein Q8R28_04690 [Dehalococcoidia bacterium]|nr:hypothetical protein [Dehalococcoidia bacterium]